MRNIERIAPLIHSLEDLFILAPDVRLGQIIVNAGHIGKCNRGMNTDSYDMFYVEDDVMQEGLDYLLASAYKSVRQFPHWGDVRQKLIDSRIKRGMSHIEAIIDVDSKIGL